MQTGLRSMSILGLSESAAFLAFLSFYAFAANAVMPANQSANCNPTSVWDGSGFICRTQRLRIGLSDVAAHKIDVACRSHQLGPDASAGEARDAFVKLVGRPTGRCSSGHVLVEGPAMNCTAFGNVDGSHTTAWRVSPTSGDLACALVASPWALRWKRCRRDHRWV